MTTSHKVVAFDSAPGLSRYAALAAGMVLMRDDGERLVREGITTPEEVLRVTRD